MGDYVNGRVMNIISGLTVNVLIGLSLAMVASSVL